MARLVELPQPWASMFEVVEDAVSGTHDWDEITKRHSMGMDRLQDATDALPDGKIEGGAVGFFAGDGEAVYMVVSEIPLLLAHVPAFDAYQIPYAHVKGLDVEDIQDEIARRKNQKRWWNL